MRSSAIIHFESCTFVYMHIPAFTCMLGPEGNLDMILRKPSLPLRQGFSWSWSSSFYVRLILPAKPGVLFPLTPKHWNYKHAPPELTVLHLVLGIELKSSCWAANTVLTEPCPKLLLFSCFEKYISVHVFVLLCCCDKSTPTKSNL